MALADVGAHLHALDRCNLWQNPRIIAAHWRCTVTFTISRALARHSTYSLQQLRELPLRYYMMSDGVALIDARQPLLVNPTESGLPKRKFQAELQPATVAK